MKRSAGNARELAPPARQLKLLATLAPGAAVVFGLLAVWSTVTTLRNLAQPMSSAVVTSLVLGTLFALAAGLVAYRLGVQVPRTLRGWEDAVAERARVTAEGRPELPTSR